jgi:aerobic carbon-monoxide dehydrogenase medium subunit
MKPPPFEYVAPQSVEEAADALAVGGEDAKVLAGGQSLVPLLSLRLARPQLLVDLNRIPELTGVRQTGVGGCTIGAMTRIHELEVNPLVVERLPLLAEGAAMVGYPAIRNRGTLGGSIAHADPAAELPAVAAALEALLIIRSVRGQRMVLASEFFKGAYATTLEPDEVLTEIRFPLRQDRTGSAVAKVPRRAGSFAVVGVAATITLNGDNCTDSCTDASIVLFGVAATPVTAPGAAEVLRGEIMTKERARQAGIAASAAIEPASDLHGSGAYRKQVAGVLTRRAVLAAAARAATARPLAAQAR